VRLERKALRTGKLEDCVAVWEIPFYAQRRYSFKLFIGLNYGIFADLLRNWTMRGVPDATFNEENIKLYEYLASHSGILPVGECLRDFNLRSVTKRRVSKRFSKAIPDLRSPSRCPGSGAKRMSLIQSLKPRILSGNFDIGGRRASALLDNRSFDMNSIQKHELIPEPRQSKLSQEQLTELQRSTHFDKKELQQWYKGMKLRSRQIAPF
jgi:hypothetical protein